MLIIPAIDLKDGNVVRYVQGRRNKKIYSKDPVKTAKYWVKSGARFLHLVDLDGAFTGKPKNIAIAKEIAKVSRIPLEFGGGVRDMKLINELVHGGIKRVVLGTKAVSDRKFLEEAATKFRNKVIVSIDAESENILIRGWQAKGGVANIFEFAKDLKKLGIKEIIYTDTLKDGTLKGPNFKMIKKMLKETGLNIIASGGVSSLEDIYSLKKMEKNGLKGVIIGKALYEGRFTLPEALRYS